ncbi:unnamed protein product [Effrenium voratum]|uniref:PARP catalytic domain-containing protein n=1 Tax=Effrenium voratum TaxID=2562239 RepID=A0AA36J1I2_9DINO|nr:unnamed protein product [Effrenium voratum]
MAAATVCQAANCSKPTQDGLPGFCSRACRRQSRKTPATAMPAQGAVFAPCSRSGCPCPASWNGQAGQHCCKRCQGGNPCGVATHMVPSAPSVTPSGPAPTATPTPAPGAVFAPCSRSGCPCPASWNGQAGQHCCKRCQGGNPCGVATHMVPSAPSVTPSGPAPTATPTPAPGAVFAPCSRSGCPCPASWNGQAGQHCCKRCQGGNPCGVATHMVPSAPSVTPSGPAPLAAGPGAFSKCARPGCRCAASYDGLPTSYCCKACRNGTPCSRNVHTVPQVQAGPSATSSNLCAAGCGRKTWNGKVGEFCGQTCRQKYSQLPPTLQLKDYAGIKAQANLWRLTVWPAAMGKGIFYGNRGLGDPSCPAMRKYEAGLAALGLTNTANSEFAWHGTRSAANVMSICWDNLDPQRRSGQAYGRGEYFSTNASVSDSYAGSTGYLILFLLLRGARNTACNGNYRVVDNPTDGRTMYCLPVGVVDYRANGDPKLKGAGNF